MNAQIKNIIEKFDWGTNTQDTINIVGSEIFVNKIYEKITSVKDGDIVVDIGANVGAFGYSIKDKNLKKIYCVEPSNGLIETLNKNLSGMPLIVINKAISSSNEDNINLPNRHNIFGHIGSDYSTITFKKFIKDNDISSIDFLKIDCEGGEYEIFNEENKNYIINNVKNVALEWHFLNEKTIENFKNFRDSYLNGYEHKVFNRYGEDVSDKILNDQYLIDFEMYHRLSFDGQFIIYISYN
jgi:FkbM family methyltransferase